MLAGRTALFITAVQLLGELAALDSDSALRRRLKDYASPGLLMIDEVGYLSYSNRHADQLFDLISRRYQAGRPWRFSLRIKHLGDWHLEDAKFPPISKHHDKYPYHGADAGRETPRWRPSLSRFLGPVLDCQAGKLREGAVVGHQHGVNAQGV